MSIKEQLQKLHNQVDKARHRLSAAQQGRDTAVVLRLTLEIETLKQRIADAKSQLNQQINSEGVNVKTLPFSRVLSKAEQGDLGKFKKSVRGIVVVHPLTALGREMGITQVTGYAQVKF